MCTLNEIAVSSPDSLVCVQDFAEHASKVLPKSVKDYYYNGACDQITLTNNEAAFNR